MMGTIGTRTVYAVLIWIAVTSAIVGQDIVSPERLYDRQLNDARCRSMGRVSIPTAQGSSAVFLSPGRLGFAATLAAGVGGQSFRGWVDDERWHETEYFKGDSRYRWYPRITHAGAAAWITEFSPDFSLAAGLGYSSPVFIGTKRLDSRQRFVSGTTRTEEHVVTNESALNVVSFGAALCRSQTLAFGLTISRSLLSKMIVDQEITYEPRQVYSVFRIRTEADITATYLSAGLAARPTDNLSLGLLFRPAFDLRAKEIQLQLFIDGTQTGAVSLPDSLMKIPALLAAGAAYLVHPLLLVAGEVELDFFSQISQAGLSDALSFRCGLETQTDYPLRLGLFHDAILVREDDWLVNEWLSGIAFGFEAGRGPVSADIFFEYSLWKHDYEFGLWGESQQAAGRDNLFIYREDNITLGATISYLLE